MCVAIYKPAGVKAPSLEVLHQCWEANPDGAGMAYNARKGGFAISKGFMKWEKFEEAYKSLAADNTHLQMFFHFRIATHGSVRPGNCHPFPISGKLSDLQACHGRYEAVLMHNGILPVTPLLKDTSDSQELARRLAAFTKKEDLVNAITLIGEFVSPSKVAIWVDKKVYLLGTWIEHDDCYFSNLTWQYSYKTYRKVGYGNGYGNGYGKGYGSCGGGRSYYYDDFDDYDYSGGGWYGHGSSSSSANTTVTVPAATTTGKESTTEKAENGANANVSFESHFPATEKVETAADPMWADPEEVEAILSGFCPLCGDQLVNMSFDGGTCQKCNIEWVIDPNAPGCEELQSLRDNTDTVPVKLLPNNLTEGEANVSEK